MKKNIVHKAILLSLTTLMTFAMLGGVEALTATADASTVYVKSTGKDYGKGTESAPYRTLERALEKVVDGGIIVLQDTVALTEWTEHKKTVTITGGNLDATSLTSLQIYDNVTFTNIGLKVNTEEYICANGYTVVMGEGVSLSNAVDVYGGGTDGTTVPGTSLTLLSGTYRCVYGGSLRGTVDGDTYLTVGGTVNANIDAFNHDGSQYFFGGGYNDRITGSTYFTFGGNAKAVHLFGGSNDGGTIGGSTNLTAEGGSSMSMYGAGRNADMNCDANTKVLGGKFEQVFGGSERADLTGRVDLRLLGGEVTRRVYGGSYNDGTSYKVSDGIVLTLGDVNVSYTSSNSDKAIYARSRYRGDVEDSQIVYASATAYSKYKDKVGGYDFGASLIMGTTSAADTYHYYTYEETDSVITQTCAIHTDFSAQATIHVDNAALQYTGDKVTPVRVLCDNEWEYDIPNVSYQDNVLPGMAKSYVEVGQVRVEKEFFIVEAPTVLGGSVRLSEPAGLRFQSKVSETLIAQGASFGTLVIPKSTLGESTLTVETETVRDIPQTKWATDSVKENYPQTYEEGYAYFNAVLMEIPAEHYDKVIVARSYVYLNGVYYYSAPIERSLAQVSAYALQDGYTEDVLYTYVDTALRDETILMESSITIEEGATYQLNLTGNKGYVAIWKTCKESIVSVDKNGCVTALKEGTATVIAQIGNSVVECQIVVKQAWTEGY